MRISSEHLSRLSEALLGLYAVVSPEELPKEFLRIARNLLDCEQLAYNEFGPNHFSSLHEPLISAELNEIFTAHLHQHPSIEYVTRTRSTKAVKISDFLGASEWYRTDLYNEFFRKLQIRHQMAFMFPVSNGQIGFAANRKRRDFSEVDRFILNMLASHLSQAVDNTRVLAKLDARLHQVADSPGGGGTIVIDGEGAVLFCSRNAGDCVSRFFGATVANRLPDALYQWFKEAMGKPTVEGLASGMLQPFTIEGPNANLTVRLMPNHLLNEHTLVLQEELKFLPYSAFKKFGLTHREVEVLNWVTQGKTNPEIAIILGISVKTVGHHVEHIMSKLGVERRGGAALWVQQTLKSLRS